MKNFVTLTSDVKRHCVTDGALDEDVTRLAGVDGAVVVSARCQFQV